MIEQAHHEHPQLSIERLCELCSVSRSWYYERTSRPESTQEEIALRDQIECIILEFPGYGYRRVTHALAREGWSVNHKRVLRQTARGVAVVSPEETLCDQNDRFATWVAGLSKRAD
jgi:putative transposase